MGNYGNYDEFGNGPEGSDGYYDYDSCGDNNGYYSSDNGMSEDSYGNGYNSEYNNNYSSDDGYGNNNGYNNDYDSEGYESSEAESEERYECPVDMQQFGEHIEAHLEDVRTHPDSRMRFRLRLRSLRKQMERVYTRCSVLFCVDVEAWEQDHDKVTEIGIAIYDPRDQELSLAPNIKTFHMVIIENEHLRNGNYVPDNSKKFCCGKSWRFTEDQASWFLQSLIDHYFDPDYEMHCSLVGHDLKGDLQWLNRLGVRIAPNVRKLDTQTVFAYTHGRDGASLKKALTTVRQPYAFLHNAGNDAYYTVMLALKLCDPGVRGLVGIDYWSNEDDSKSVPTDALLQSMLR
ncbi:hypothetical protein OXX59_001649 [Metschnikowia pulcherrima]